MNRGIIGTDRRSHRHRHYRCGKLVHGRSDRARRALRYGAVIGTAQPGLGFKIPLIDSVEKISVKTSPMPGTR